MPAAIVAYAAYIPRHRLQSADIAAALGAGGRANGARALASYDEDSTTLGVEAARRALRDGYRPEAIYFATTAPAYLDKTNAAAIHAALDLGREGLAVDLAGSARSAIGALSAAAASGGLAVLADLRTGLPGSADERGGADAAAAFVFAESDDAVATVLARASLTAEFLDRWRTPGELASRQWEERFGLQMYAPLIRDAAREALARAGLDTPDHVIVSSPHARAATSGAKELGSGDVAAADRLRRRRRSRRSARRRARSRAARRDDPACRRGRRRRRAGAARRRGDRGAAPAEAGRRTRQRPAATSATSPT